MAPPTPGPDEVVISVIKPKVVESSEAAAALHDALEAAGIEVLLDDRHERPGVKFKDADLVGIPHRITLGPRGLAEGKVEWTARRGGEVRDLDLHKAAEVVAEAVLEERGHSF